jgi:transcriptional regulator of acetoin/glycerol metabolism
MHTSSVVEVDDTRLRPEIALAWRRAVLNGLDPGAEIGGPVSSETNQQSRLAVAAGPVLDRMSAELAGSRFTVLLSDRNAHIINRRMGRRDLEKRLDRVRATPGAQFVEETSGTNALATAYELQRPIAVNGAEHFLESMKMFCCFGAPIIHPVTHRLEGVLDVTAPVEDYTPLLDPFVMRAAGEITQRLFDGARLSEQRLLTAFQARSRNKTHPVLVLGADVLLSNNPALDQVQNSDYAMLRYIAGELSEDESIERPITLSSGIRCVVRIGSVPDTPGGVVVEILPQAELVKANGANYTRDVGPVPTDTGPTPTRPNNITLIIGEPGSGRTTRAQEIVGHGAVMLDAVESVVDEDTWLRRAVSALNSAPPTVIDNIGVLAPRLAACLTHSVRTARCAVVMTSSPLRELGSEQAALAAEAVDRHELPPVRLYKEGFITLANSALRQLDPASALVIAPSVLRLLAAHSWPGNVRELQAVLRHAARGRECGFIIDTDLPADYRSVDTKYLTPMERAECAAIVEVLRSVDGNKAAAAAELGISRTTLYDRLRRYKISTEAQR